MNSKTANQIMDIQEHLKEKQTGTRFLHTLGVEYTSVCLAMKYGADQTKAGLAGLLHDCAKHMAPEKLLKICREHKMTISAAQLAQPFCFTGRLVHTWLVKSTMLRIQIFLMLFFIIQQGGRQCLFWKKLYLLRIILNRPGIGLRIG